MAWNEGGEARRSKVPKILGKAETSPPQNSNQLRSRLQSEVHCFRILGGDRYLLRRSSKLFMPRFDRVITGRQALDLERSVFAGDCKERVLQDANITLHPRMDVAFHRNHH